jgi:single stranded DNA-binding protein
VPIKTIGRANRLSRAFSEGLKRWARRQELHSPGGHCKRPPKRPKPTVHVSYEQALESAIAGTAAMIGLEVAFQGRLGRDPELRHVKGGELALLSFTAAVETGEQGSDRSEAPPATWIRVAVFGERAEELQRRFAKCDRVYVEGRLEASIWNPGDGREQRVNLNVTASLCQPFSQIGRRRPSSNGYRGDRARRAPTDQEQDRAARWTLGRQETPFYDDSEAAIADLGHSIASGVQENGGGR